MNKSLTILSLILFIAPSVVHAQEPVAKTIQSFEDFSIKGEIQKPNINIFIGRMNLDKAYELKLRESFIPKIKESMKKKPF